MHWSLLLVLLLATRAAARRRQPDWEGRANAKKKSQEVAALLADEVRCMRPGPLGQGPAASVPWSVLTEHVSRKARLGGQAMLNQGTRVGGVGLAPPRLHTLDVLDDSHQFLWPRAL